MSVYLRGKIWWMRYTHNGKEFRETTKCTRKSDASKLLIARKYELGVAIHPILLEDTKMTFQEFVDTEYWPKHASQQKSRQFYATILKRLNKYFGHILLASFSPYLIKEYQLARKKEYVWGHSKTKTVSGTTINRELAVLRHILNMAVEWNKLRSSPIGRIKMAKEQNKEKFFSDDAIASLISNASEPLRSYIFIAVNTGMRLREIMGLQWREVDFERNLITITAKRTKSNTIRHIPMAPSVSALLAEFKLKSGGNEYVFPNPATGKPQKWISHSWPRLLKRCNIEAGARFHDLRHTWATRAMGAGVPPVDVQHILGHANITTTSRYSHSTDEGKRRAIEKAAFNMPAGQLEQISRLATK